MSPRKRLAALVALLVALVAVAVIVVKPKGSTPHSTHLSTGALASALAGSPPVLASLHTQGNHLLTGGTGAFKVRLKQLRGYPVVINEWASWCEPCQSEFPVFQRVAVLDGRKVAFVGVDSRDANAAAAAFLGRFPVAYPSYADPSQSIGRLLEAVGGIPQTVYLDRTGKEVFDHAGPYLSVGSLERDIRRYVLQ